MKGARALAICCLVAACDVGVIEEEEEAGHAPQATGSCPLDRAGVYSPYADDGRYPAGPVDDLPWRGPTGSYPDGLEDFRGYGTLPVTVECASDKGRRSHLDVTAGCLEAVAVGDAHYQRGLVHTTGEGYFRAVALGHTAGDELPVKWTDQAIEVRFFHRGRTGSAGMPGFKLFARYRSEDDLYVASWRFDGVVQIQRKLCGEYAVLARREMSAPSANTWHWMRLEALGEDLTLYLDDRAVLHAESGTFSWGTAGIRIDSADGAYLDDWSISDPGA
ncbi:MAG TPA: hypothetical protein VFU21_15305 [Kofleriaceae bacterium]|nr:hypothetical protein [Kofleriaceae bacterium]